ncbi:MAG: hypothetical protein ACOZAO_02135 [Patescibacteria group bacterium]
MLNKLNDRVTSLKPLVHSVVKFAKKVKSITLQLLKIRDVRIVLACIAGYFALFFIMLNISLNAFRTYVFLSDVVYWMFHFAAFALIEYTLKHAKLTLLFISVSVLSWASAALVGMTIFDALGSYFALRAYGEYLPIGTYLTHILAPYGLIWKPFHSVIILLGLPFAIALVLRFKRGHSLKVTLN